MIDIYQLYRKAQWFDKPKYPIGSTVGFPVDDDGETIYLEAIVEDIVSTLVNGQVVHQYYVKIIEENDWIPAGKKKFIPEDKLAAEPTPIAG